MSLALACCQCWLLATDTHSSAAVTGGPEEAVEPSLPQRGVGPERLLCCPVDPAMFPRQLFQPSLFAWSSACPRTPPPGSRPASRLAPTGQQVWPPGKAGLQLSRSGWAAQAPTGHPHGGQEPSPQFHLAIRGCAAPRGWLYPPGSGPTLPACAVLTPFAGCPDGRTDPQAIKGGCGEAKWDSDLTSQLGSSQQILPCRLASELEASAWVSQRQDPLHGEEGRAQSPGSEDTRSPDTCGSW